MTQTDAETAAATGRENCHCTSQTEGCAQSDTRIYQLTVLEPEQCTCHNVRYNNENLTCAAVKNATE